MTSMLVFRAEKCSAHPLLQAQGGIFCLLTGLTAFVCSAKVLTETECIEGQQACWMRKDYFDHFSFAQVIIVRVLSFFSFLITLVSFPLCTQIFFFMHCKVAENDNCQQ